MQHQLGVEAGIRDGFLDLTQEVELELRHVALGIDAVAGSDGDGERVDAGLLDELHGLVRLRVVDDLAKGLVGVGHADVAQLRLNRDVACPERRHVRERVARGHLSGARVLSVGAHLPHLRHVCDLDDLLGDGHVLVERLRGGVDHDGRVAAADGSHNTAQVRAVVQVDDGRNRRCGDALADGCNDIRAQVLQLIGVNLDDDRRVLLLGDVHDSVEHGIAADVERGNRKLVLVRRCEQLLHVHEHDGILSSKRGPPRGYICLTG